HETVARLAHLHEVDVLMLAECPTTVGTMLKTLNGDREMPLYEFAPTFDRDHRLPIYVLFSHEFVAPIEDANRFTVREIRLPAVTPILLAVAHCPSKRHMTDGDQEQYLIEFADRIRRIEARVGHSRTILVGDFNVNPFENGMIGAKG